MEKISGVANHEAPINNWLKTDYIDSILFTVVDDKWLISSLVWSQQEALRGLDKFMDRGNEWI